MQHFWTEEDKARLARVATLEEAADVALAVLERMNQHASQHGREIVQVCGPMSTGGLGNIAANMAHFERAVNVLKHRGLLVFDQMPFQDAIIRICKYKEGDGKYHVEILEVFYRRIFESGHVKRAYFLRDWESSRGATWERWICTELGIIVDEYPDEWLQQATS